MSKYPARITVPVTLETRAIYEQAAASLDLEMTVWVRQWLEESLPTMHAIIEARRQGGVGPLQAFMRSALQQGQEAVAEFDEEHRPATESA